MKEHGKKFTRFSFFKTYVIPAFLLFLIPLFSWWFFRYVQAAFDRQASEQFQQDIRRDVQATPEERAKALDFFCHTPLSRVLASSDHRFDDLRSQISTSVRFEYALFRWLIRLAAASIIAGVVVVVLAGLSVLWSLRSPAAQYYSLSIGWHVLRIFSTAQVIIQGGLALALSYWVTVFWFNCYYPKLIMIAGVLAVCAIAAVITAIFKKPNEKFELAGELIEREPGSPLWNDLDQICARVGTVAPDRVIAGIDNNFFVTEHPVTLDGKTYDGRTLYVSLSLLKVLHGSQADAVMAHEAAHFSGNDTMFSRKISPLLNRYQAYLEALRVGVLSLPIFYFMFCFRSLFQISLSRLSRQRELLADKIAASVVSPHDFAAGLLRISAYCHYRGKVEEELFKTEQVLDAVGIASRVSTGFQEYARSFVNAGAANEAETVHPFDSHPPFEERLQAVKVSLPVDEMLNILQAEVDAKWYQNIRQAEELEKKQWAAYEDGFRQCHEQALAYRYLPETDAEKELVLKYFPGLSFQGKKKSLLSMTYEKVVYSGWPDPLLFDEITKCTVEKSILGHPLLRIHFFRGGKNKRTIPLDTFLSDTQTVLDAFNRFYVRHTSMKAYRREKRLESAA